ncbi:MAG: DNA polymerase III subunit delta [Candidatus Aminicenantes bacterium]
MYSFLLNKEIDENTAASCYFFYGEETFLAYQFIQELKESLISADVQDYNVERFDLQEHTWMEIIDLARTVPFFLSSRRIILVEAAKGKGESLSSSEKKILKDYFSSPSTQTVMVIIFSGKIRKNSSLFKFFTSLPGSLVFMKELRPLRERALFAWMDRKLNSLEKTASVEAKERVKELAGNDLRRVNNELEKLVTFIGEKKEIELDDVNQVSGWVKTFFEWEMSESLERADFNQAVMVLNNLFKEGTRPEFIVGIITRFFRDIFLAKLWLKERDKDRKAIFRELKPHIQERYGKFYRDKFNQFFSLVERLSLSGLNHFLDELRKIDLKIKTSDASAQSLLESFLFDYCFLSQRERVTWKKG